MTDRAALRHGAEALPEPAASWTSTGRRPSGAPLEALVNSLCMGLPFEPAEKQALLEAPDLAGRFEALTTLLEIDAAGGDDERPSLQ